MKSRYFPMLGTIFAFTAAGGLLLPSAAPALSTEVEAEEDLEVLTRGPVHEAFAESVSYEPEAGLIVASAPPEMIEELPPEQQPEGDNVTWIPGYWAWDDDQSDFLWISGVWRNIPPGRQWVPGYWDPIDSARFQWVSGYWADAEDEEVDYISTAPPESVDTGPNIAAPSDDHTWVPGNWRYVETRYVWSPGYWTPLRPNWTWVPSRYCWTPRGYVYVDGYWDYAVVNRGVLFAPVHFHRPVYVRAGYHYTPSIVVSLNVFADHLFIRPRCRHYYFGDYYAPRYRDAGFYAAFRWHRARRGYDPIYAYQRWHHRQDRAWERRHEENFNFFRDNDRFRPPHTWAVMRGLRNERFEDDRNRSRLFANSFEGFVKNPERGQRFRALNQERRQQLVEQRREMRTFTRIRKEVEGRPVVADGGAKTSFREKLRRSPVVGRDPAQFKGDQAPPKRPEARGGRSGRAIQGRDGAAGNDDKLTQKEKLRRAMGRGDNTGRPGGEGAADDGKLTQREKLRRAAGKDTKPGPDAPSKPDADGPGRGKAADRATDDGKPTQREKIRRAAGKGDTAKPEPKRESAPERRVTPQRGKQRPEAAPERKAQPKPEVPQRKRQAAPERKPQPRPEAREVPQRKQVAPRQERQTRPTPAQPRKQQANPERKKQQPKEQASRQQRGTPQIAARRAPQAKPQARQAPRQQARQAPQQRKAQASQPRTQARQAAPQRRQQAAPRQQVRRQQPQRQQPRQAQPQREGRKKDRRGE